MMRNGMGKEEKLNYTGICYIFLGAVAGITGFRVPHFRMSLDDGVCTGVYYRVTTICRPERELHIYVVD